jgi:ribonuclease E
MTKRMLIDATHAEETRVVVLDGNRLEDFDVETSTKKQLKGNIYLAKVVRVEPSLQAAFVEYGGNRHGFLAFGEIHPDYYQIPVADRQRLLDMQAEDARREQDEDDREAMAASVREAAGEPEPAEDSDPAEDSGDSIVDGSTEGADGSTASDSTERAEEPRDSAANSYDIAEQPREAGAPDTVESATASSEPATAARAQPLRIETESVGGAVDAAPPDDDAEAFRVPAAAAPGEPDASGTHPEVVGTIVAPAAETLRDGSDGVHIAAAQPVTPKVEATVVEASAVEMTGAEVMGAGQRESESRESESGESESGESESGESESGESESRDADAQAGNSETADFESDGEGIPDAPPPETVGGDADGAEDARERRIPPRFLRNYKIQEVIRRRQILLVQVVKEERGTKGAALTTYISLAGRYCVLMPNSPRGGGISRKITSATDRRRLKEVTAELDIPDGMGLIVRTAGANRPKPEIKRDCEYLMRLWDDIRAHTMKSVAPALIYEEASLIKRAIRDVYSRDIDEILVDGEDGWKAARDFMRMLMPAHVKKVQFWRDTQPLFARQQVEDQLDAMLVPTVQLRSGGYLVINQTEALVAIDVNSGRSTRERGIEETALRTNLEAVDEVARQLRLRDLAGLIVIDLIDMESRKNNASVERRLKEALKVDRARIQVGHISHFGLMEMSRQRLRPSLAETSFVTCPHCGGTGHVRGTESAAIHVLRDIEEEGAKRRASEILVRVASPIAMYILNHKRARLGEIEARYAMHVVFTGDDSLIPPQIRVERIRAAIEAPVAVTQDVRPEPEAPADSVAEVEDAFEDVEDEDVETEGTEPSGGRAPGPRVMSDRADGGRAAAASGDAPEGETETAEEAERRRRRRRRRRRSGRREDGAPGSTESAPGPTVPGEGANEEAGLVAADLEEHIEGVPEHEDGVPDSRQGSEQVEAQGDGDDEARGRRRGRRGGRRRRRDGSEGGVESVAVPGAEQPELPPIYTGPTPANPFGGQVFDIFDVLEQAERAADRPFAVAPPPVAEPQPELISRRPAELESERVPERVMKAPEPMATYVPEAASEHALDPSPEPALAPEPAPAPEPAAEAIATEAAPMPDAGTAAPEPVAMAPEPVMDAPPPPVPANDAAPEPLIKPVLVGVEDAPVAEKKRGWWRR